MTPAPRQITSHSNVLSQRESESMLRAYLRSFFHLMRAIPLPVRVVVLLGMGLVIGLVWPQSSVVKNIYLSGTYLPKLIVTLAGLIIFLLLAGTMSKLILQHKNRAGTLFVRILTLYVGVGFISTIYATTWLGCFSNLPISLSGASPLKPVGGARQIVGLFSNLVSQQPLLQVLFGAMLLGWIVARVPALHRAAYGFISAGDLIIKLFCKLLWYYPIMVGCLAIGIPMKFGRTGLSLYGNCVLWEMLVILPWCVLMILFCKVATRRSWMQIFSYYGTVWPTGFGTGGSYDTLAVNLVSAEKDLGLSPEITEISILFGTVLNKGCATMSVLIVTVFVARLLSVPISLKEISLLIPPVTILGLETPGIPGGAGYFMSPILAVLLHVPNKAEWVTTFIAVYSGLIPMLSTAGNTTTDGVVGAILEDCYKPAPNNGEVSPRTTPAKRQQL